MKNKHIEINELISKYNKEGTLDTNLVSDGYHTFGELYKHRIHLFIALSKSLNKNYSVIKSTRHSDETIWDGWFIVQIEHKHIGQISYHLPKEYWDRCDFIQTVEKANEWDGHTSDDVLERLLLI